MADNPVGGGSGGIQNPKNLPENIPQMEPGQGSGDDSFGPMVGKPEGGSTAEMGNTSPMNIASQQQSSMPPRSGSIEELGKGLNKALEQMNNLQGLLATPNLKLNQRSRKLLRAKFGRVQDHLDYLNSKLDLSDEDEGGGGGKNKQENEISEVEGSDSNVISKFIGYLTDGQSQLRRAMDETKKINETAKKNPSLAISDIFSMQVKVYRAQVELEFASAVVQKSIDDLKTLMNVQL